MLLHSPYKDTQLESGVLDKRTLGNVATIVLAGGQGTRLFPLTISRCKPAVSFGGRYRLIDIPLSNSLNSGINKIFVISQYLASSLQEHIITTYSGHRSHIHLICPEETAKKKIWFQGTADAVRQNKEHLAQTSADYFLILSGDQLYNIDFQNMLSFAISKNADLVVATIKASVTDAKRMGVLHVDEEGCIQDFIEKPKNPTALEGFYDPESKTCLGSMGIYIFKRSALFAALEQEGEDFGKHIIPHFIKGGTSYAFVYDGYWVDIGTIASYYQANLALTREKICLNTYDETHPIYAEHDNLPSPIIKNTLIKDSLISQGAIVEAQEISHSIIGIRAHIKQGSILRDSILLGNHFYHPPAYQSPPLPFEFSIGEDCVIEKTIIDEHAHIGNRVRLINEKGLDTFDGNGIYIRDGIIIVTTGTHIPDDFVL